MESLKRIVSLSRNERGQVTLDFIFSGALILVTGVILMSICIGLTLVEVMQYVSFSGARAYFVADYEETTQVENALIKIKNLIAALPVLNNKENGWIEIKPFQSNVRDWKEAYGSAAAKRPYHSGVELSFELKILKINIPFLGAALSYNGADTPEARVSSLLGREPSFTECRELMKRTVDVIVQKSPNYQRMRMHGIGEQRFEPILDNGC